MHAERARTLPDALEFAPRLAIAPSTPGDGSLPRRQAEFAAEHGPVFRGDIPLGPDAGPCVHLVGSTVAEQALLVQRELFGSDEGWRPVLGMGFGRAVLNVDEPDHARQRKLISPAFAGSMLNSYVPRILSTVERTLAPWRDGGEVDAYAAMRALAFDAVASTLAGMPDDVTADCYRTLVVILNGYDFETESREDFLARAGLARSAFLARLHAFVRERRRSLPPTPRSMADIVLAPGAMDSDDEAVAMLAILLIAGHDTGAVMYSRAVWLLATMPALAAALASELREAGWRDGDPLPVEAIDRLPLMERFMLETGRLYPPLVNLPRVAIADIEVGGYRVAAGTRIALSVAGAHLSARVHRDPLRFDPNRYADPDAMRNAKPFMMLTFAGGGRMCIGMRFAQIEFKAIVARAVTRLALEPVDPTPVAHTGFWSGRPARNFEIRVRALDR